MTTASPRRIALITGGAAGLGQAFAARLARDGADIVIADLQDAGETVALVEKEGRRGLFVHCDVTSEQDVTALGEAANEAFGHVDILVSNAGIYPNAELATLSLADWRHVFAVNVDGAFLVTRTFLPPMRQRGWGRVIFLASASFHVGSPGFPHYVASKGALIGFMHALATESGGDGVTVNAIAPSIVTTQGTLREASQEAFDLTRQMQAIPRTQEPGDVTGALSFLASDAAAFVTGQTIVVDGGLTRT
jgi:(S)-1-phenylethanol dehydrogenase